VFSRAVFVVRSVVLCVNVTVLWRTGGIFWTFRADRQPASTSGSERFVLCGTILFLIRATDQRTTMPI